MVALVVILITGWQPLLGHFANDLIELLNFFSKIIGNTYALAVTDFQIVSGIQLLCWILDNLRLLCQII